MIDCPAQNSHSSIAISTSVGFRPLEVDEYIQSAKTLKPDINIGIADLITADRISQKRIEKSADRTHAWTRDTVAARENAGDTSAFFASIPSLEPQQQSFYLSDLTTDYKHLLSGLALYSVETAVQLPDSLEDLPRFCLIDAKSPHEILRAVSLGNDLITVPFVTATSESGVAMTFSFQEEITATEVPLGFDLWDPAHATDLSALKEGCTCYTCSKHHRAFIHHLLSAKEMLAWTLLQIHNFHTINQFFGSLRSSIADGSFEEKSKLFGRAYSADIPRTAGEGPRIRGYQSKSVGGGEPKKNRKVYGRLDEHARKLEEAESGVPTPEEGTVAEDLEKQGLGVQG